jgi:osmotically-inducible protein OsmY
MTGVYNREEEEMVAVIERTTVDLRGEVLRALAARTQFENADIRVEEVDGIVTLTGMVDCHARRLAAEEAARSVLGVRGVANDIRIARDGVFGWRDIDLLEGAGQILRAHYLFAGKKIGVAANRGFVSLSGRVHSLFERVEAERAVSCLPNLRGVRNEIEVIPPRVAPDELNHQAVDALHRVLGGAAASVDVRVERRGVALLGTVRSARDKTACRETVSAMRGVAEVDDLLDVDPET